MSAVWPSNRVVVTVRDPGGAPRDVSVLAAPIQDLRTKLPAPPGVDPLPRWLQRIDEGYWLDSIPELDALYVQINQMRDIEDGESVTGFADRTRAALVESRARELILDLRHNNGGGNFTIWPIVRLVGWHEMEGGRTWAIDSRNTFSAAQDLVNFLDRATGTHFIGEESGSRPNFVGEDFAGRDPVLEALGRFLSSP